MTKQRTFVLLTAVAVAGGVVVAFGLHRPRLVLTGLVTTDETIVSSEIQGRLQQLTVAPGDPVKRGQLLGSVAVAEGKADLAYSESVVQSATALVDQAEADFRFQKELTAQQL